MYSCILDLKGNKMRDKQKQVQIPLELFHMILMYCNGMKIENLETIQKGLNEKLERLALRELYTEFKTAPTQEQREQARQMYLDKIGVPEGFRW